MIQNRLTQYSENKAHREYIELHPYCEMCGITNKEVLCVHHILKKSRYPEYRNDKRNWAVLCWKCHLLTETGGLYKGIPITALQFNNLIKYKHKISTTRNIFLK